jgi:2-polyprenyl-3-methyl-5-hydroxy-6-metoxy-1,4-benzoquinol methylase
VCGALGAERTLTGREDREYGIAATLSYWRCSGCRLVFADPMPDATTVASFYANYTTHASKPIAASWLGRALAKALKHVRKRELQATMRSLPPQSRCLDYGCGAGGTLQLLRDLGLQNRTGYEPDPKAHAVAQKSGNKVHTTEQDALADGPFDFVLLDHVIEHLPNPAATLQTLAAAMSAGAVLLIRTPNTRSMLASVFGPRWRGWETPRHLCLFNRNSIEALGTALQVAELRVVRLSSSNRMFVGMAQGSVRTMHKKRMCKLQQLMILLSWPVAEVIRHLARPFGVLLGEELVVTLRLQSTGGRSVSGQPSHLEPRR